MIKQQHRPRTSRAVSGFTVLELVVVLVVMAVMAAVSVPQILVMRKLMRFNGVPLEIGAQLRLTRQLAMSQRQVFKFRYDDVTKQASIIDNQERGTIANPLANNTANDTVYRTVPLGRGGLPPDLIAYGPPPGAPTSLPDGTPMTMLAGGRVEIVFQPDGSVVDANGNPASAALFFHDAEMPDTTGVAISVIGAGGRVKNWRYSQDARVYVK